MYLIKSLTLLQISFLLAACGFEPIYKRDSANIKTCDNFSVSTEGYSEYSVYLKAELREKLNESCTNPNQKYKVNIALDKELSAASIQRDREVSRYNVNLKANYKLESFGKNSKELTQVDTGTTSLIGAFDAVESDYGTYAQEQDTSINLAKEIARDLALKILMKIKTN